jgi:cobalt-zinc-cadmium efflux system outer membrane protein
MNATHGLWGLATTLALLAGCQSASAVREGRSPLFTSVPIRGATAPKHTSRKPSEAVNTQVVAQAIGSSLEREQAAVEEPVRLVAHETPLPPAPNGELPLTLDAAIAVSLDRNPNLVALRANDPVAGAAYHVAETYPWNPFVQVQVLPYSRDEAGNNLSVNHYVWLMQTLELAHQRQHREASAAASWNQVRWNIVQAELTNSAQTERLYFTAIYQRDLRDLAARTASLNAELQGIVERRFKAGLGNAAELTTARVTARQSRKQAELAEATFQTAVLALRRQLNMPGEEPLALIGKLPEFVWLPVAPADFAHPADDPWKIEISGELVAQLASVRPDILAATSGVQMARANADLARANQKQNVAIGPIYDRDEDGTVFVGFRTQMNLPVWDNGRPLTAQREAECNLQWVTLDQLHARARIEAQTAIERYERARRLIERDGDPTPRTSAELQNLREHYESGQADILNVFAAQNGLLQEYRTYLDLLNEVAQAAADVTQMTGLPPARLMTTNSTTAPQKSEPAEI